jgi:hypothetical protein
MNTAKFVKEIVVIDPDSKGEVSLSVFKHENGGMFALDNSYIEQVLPEEGECPIPDPFAELPDDVFKYNDGDNIVNLTGV